MILKKFLFTAILSALFLSGFSQVPGKVTIKGQVSDENHNEGGFATVMLLNPKDSTLLNFTQCNEHGIFAFSNVKNIPYLFKVSYIGYLPYQQALQPSTAAINDLGIVLIKPIVKELFEVVVRDAKAPLMIRGDTIEYDATTFKAPPGSTVEDLLKRLPGIEVDAAGNVKAQGKEVQKVYVDGKTFFGDDPTGATKNLDANAVSKVQVFDEKSEQSKLTGVEDGVKEKAMNLELKDAYKKGSFGKITLAGGANEEGVGRWAARGNFNRFTKNSQLSFIGYANNINETGVNWEDYGEFKGQATFNNYDNGDFGFSSGRGRYYYFQNDDNIMSYFDGRGFTKNYGAGVNYNFDDKKTKFNVSYFYKNNKQDFFQQVYKETFFSDATSFFNNDTTHYDDVKQNHIISSRFEYNIDSNNVFIAKINFRYGKSVTESYSTKFYSDNLQQLINELFTNNKGTKYNTKISGTTIFRHKFKKKGRSFALSAAFNRAPNDDENDYYSMNHSYLPVFADEIDRYSDNYATNQQVKASALYTEPLSKKFFMEFFYNFNTSTSESDNKVSNALLDYITIDSLSIFYNHKVLINRLGTDLRFSYNGINIMLGLAEQNIQMTGKYRPYGNYVGVPEPLKKEYWSLSPNVNMEFELPKNMYLSMDYGYELSEPSFTDLQPIPEISNPLYIKKGNMDLVPERTHTVSMNYYYYNPASFTNIGFNVSYDYCYNSISYNQKLMLVDSLGIVTISTPDNNASSNRINSWAWTSYPIIKTKLTNSWNLGFNYNNGGAYVNETFNETQTYFYYARTSFNITATPKITFTIDGDASLNQTLYSMNSDRNQLIQNYSAGISGKWQFAKKSFFETNLDYSYYKNSLYNFEKSIPIFNASIRQVIGKKNRYEMRIAAFDIFNQRKYIQQWAYDNSYTRSTAETLARYFMLSVSYNIKGHDTKLKKKEFWD